MKKVVNFIKVLLGVIFFAFAILMTILLLNYNDYGVTQFGDTSLVIVRDDLSSQKYKKGDLVIVKSSKLNKLKKGDEVFAYKIDSKGRASIDLGSIGEIYNDENAIAFENGSTYSIDFVVGKASKSYDKVGTYLSIIESKWGFLFVILVPSFLIFIYEVYSLIVEIKYGNEE